MLRRLDGGRPRRSSGAARSGARARDAHLALDHARPRGRPAGLRPRLQRGRPAAAQGPHAGATERHDGATTTSAPDRVGYATSFMYSPVLQRHIALARVRPDLAAAGHAASSSSSRSTTSTSRSAPRSPGRRSSTPNARRREMTTSEHEPVVTPPTTYDAIVVGGGHNGLVNGAYLAKAGLRTLILERRAVVGGAAITEELRPGFKFTTFSYALCLLRPQIVHDLDLVKHGFLPLLMPSTFGPTENGDYLVHGPGPRPRTSSRSPGTAGRRRRLRPVRARHRAWSSARSSRCSTRRRPTSSRRPRGPRRARRPGRHLRGIDSRTVCTTSSAC